MNVQPGFLDHPKTQKLVRLAGDNSAWAWVIRLWEFCQLEKTDLFEDMNAEAINDVCRELSDRTGGSPDELLLHCGFISREGDQVIVTDFYELNSGLFRSWKGAKSKMKRNSKDPLDPLKGVITTPNDTLKSPKGSLKSSKGSKSVPYDINDINEINKSKGVRGARAIAQAQQWMQECLLEDDRFKCLDGLYTAQNLFKDFIAHRQVMPLAKRLSGKKAVSLMLLDAKKAVDLGGELLLCHMLADAIKSGWQGWWFSDRAVNLNKELEKAEVAKSGSAGGVAEFPNSNTG